MSRAAECAVLMAPLALCAAAWIWNAWRSERRSRRLAKTLDRRARL